MEHVPKRKYLLVLPGALGVPILARASAHVPLYTAWHKNGNAQVRVDPFVQEHNCRLGMKDLQGQREAIVCFQHGEQKIIA